MNAGKATRNTAFLLASKGVDGLTQLASMAIIARFLGAQRFGEYAFVITITFMLGMLVSFGTSNILIREIAKDPEKASLYTATVLAIRLAMAVLAMAVITGLHFFFSFSDFIIHGMYLLGFAYCLQSITKTFEEVYIAHERMGFILYLTVGYRLLGFFIILVAYLYKTDPLWVYYSYLVSFLIQGIVSAVICKKYFFAMDYRVSRQLLLFFIRESSLLFGSLLFRQLNIRIDVFFLQALVSSRELSFFHAPHRIIMNLQPLPASIANGIFPQLTKIAEDSKELLGEYFERIFKVIFIVGLIATGISNIWAKDIILLLFSEEFLSAVLCFKILSWAFITVLLNALLEIFLIVTSQQKKIFQANIIGCIINCVLDAALISKYGAVGASWASSIAYLLMTSLLFHGLNTTFAKKSLYPFIAKAIASTILCFLAVEYSLSQWRIIESLVFVTITAGLLLVMKVITLKEVHTIVNFLSNKKKRPAGPRPICPPPRST